MKVVFGVLVFVVVVSLGYWFLLRPWHSRWGATDEELAIRLPGDEVVPEPDMVSTRAVTVAAPAVTVYAWLAQLGQGRGGMYSYEWLENLIGCNIHNVYRIVPELQQLTVGQVIAMGPEGYPFYRVLSFEPDKALVLQPGNPVTKEPGEGTWVFVLVERPDGTTRLISRQRARVGAGLGEFIIWRVITEPVDFIMEQKMMRTIRDLAEAQARS